MTLISDDLPSLADLGLVEVGTSSPRIKGETEGFL
jgi:hypothetical protein